MFVKDSKLYRTIRDTYLSLNGRRTECGYLMQIMEQDYAEKRTQEVVIRLDENVLKDLKSICEKLEKIIAEYKEN